jgi:hypothetical protein
LTKPGSLFFPGIINPAGIASDFDQSCPTLLYNLTNELLSEFPAFFNQAV